MIVAEVLKFFLKLICCLAVKIYHSNFLQEDFIVDQVLGLRHDKVLYRTEENLSAKMLWKPEYTGRNSRERYRRTAKLISHDERIEDCVVKQCRVEQC